MSDKIYKVLLYVAAFVMPIVCGGVMYALVTDEYEAFEHFGFFKFLTSSEWCLKIVSIRGKFQDFPIWGFSSNPGLVLY